jgi:hypothetical protein
MKVKSQFQVPAALHSQKETSVPMGYKVRQAPKFIGFQLVFATLMNREQFTWKTDQYACPINIFESGTQFITLILINKESLSFNHNLLNYVNRET